MSNTPLIYIDHKHAEWNGMWDEIAKQPLNNGDPLCLNQGFSWEYVSSSTDHHYFRHQCHPLTNRPEHIYLERTTSQFHWTAMSA